MKAIATALNLTKTYKNAINRLEKLLGKDFETCVEAIHKSNSHIVVCGIGKSGLVGRRSWSEKSRKLDVYDIKSDTLRTLVELGLEEKDLFISSFTKESYHPGRSGSVYLKSEKGPHLAYFGEVHPSILQKLDFKDKNVFGFEIFLKNIPEPNKKLRISRKNYVVSDFQKSERDFAFVIDKSFKVGELEKFIMKVDENIIQNVTTFDVFIGGNVPEDKKSVAINVTLQALDKTLTEKDIDQVSQKIIEAVKDKTGATIRS